MHHDGVPFLIRNGGWLWIPAAAIAMAWWLVRPYLVVRRRTRRWCRHARAELGAARTTTAGLRDGARATLRGRIVGGAPIETVWAHGREWRKTLHVPIHASLGGRLSLDDGTELELGGPIAVVAGSSARAAWGMRPVATDAPELITPEWERLRVAQRATTFVGGRIWAACRSVRAGDEVVVAGTAQLVADSDAAAYRDAPTRWRLGDAADRSKAPTVQIVAARPALGVPAPRGWWLAARVASGALVLVAASWLGGKAVLGVATHGGDEPYAALSADDDLELTNHDTIAIAAAIPWTRTDALHALHRALASRHDLTLAGVRRLAAVAGLADGCRDEIAVLMSRADYDDAGDAAIACGDAVTLAWTEVARGRYADASVALRRAPPDKVPPLLGVVVALAVDDRAGAAAQIARLEQEIRGWEPGGHWPDVAIPVLDCLSAYLRAPDDPNARAALAEAANRSDRELCRPLLVLTLPKEGAADAIHRWAPYLSFRDNDSWQVSRHGEEAGELLVPLALVAGVPMRDELDASELSRDDLRSTEAVTLWTGVAVDHPVIELAAALRAHLDGRPSEIPAHVARARLWVASGDGDNDVVDRVATRLAFLEGRLDLRLDPVFETDAEMLRTGVRPARYAGYARDYVAMIDRAIAGDAGPLAAWLADGADSPSDDELLALAPRARTGRTELRDFWRWDAERWHAAADPSKLLWEAMRARDFYAAIGATDDAAAAQARIRAQLRVLDRPDRAVPLIILRIVMSDGFLEDAQYEPS